MSERIALLKENRLLLKNISDEKQAALHAKDIEYNAVKKGYEYILSEYEKAKKLKDQRETNNANAGEELKRIEESLKKLNLQLEECKLHVIQTNSELNELSIKEGKLKSSLTEEEAKLTDLKLKQMEYDSKIQLITSSYEDAFGKAK